ncbi:MAG: N-(5'-phosphoribosyl)anthranilate isomerase [Meiothermus sp.]
MTRAKICGITRPEDAVLAERLGAWAVGFILVPNTKRYRPPQHARWISQQLGPFICRVGVFQDAPPEAVLEHMAQARLQVAQLHGSEPPAWAEAVREHYPVIKAFKLSGPPDPALLAQALDYPCDALMVDGANPGSGQGYPLEWLEPFRGHPRLIVAGGLNPENLAPVLALRPYGVDVSSGVEQSPGVKDGQRVGDFLDLVSRLARR